MSLGSINVGLRRGLLIEQKEERKQKTQQGQPPGGAGRSQLPPGYAEEKRRQQHIYTTADTYIFYKYRRCKHLPDHTLAALQACGRGVLSRLRARTNIMTHTITNRDTNMF